MAHDVIISYCSRDRPTADAVCAWLEASDIRCWIAPRDIRPGLDWSEAILEAIRGSRVMVLIFSEAANSSPQVKREVDCAVNEGLAVIPFRIEAVEPRGSLEYYLRTTHWLDALTPRLEEHLERLTVAAASFLREARRGPAASGAGEGSGPIAREGAPQESEFENPYNFVNTATRDTFKGREDEIGALLDSVESGTHVAVYGLQRIGKTSLVEETLVEKIRGRRRLRDSTLFCRLDLQRMGTERINYDSFFRAIIEAIVDAAHQQMGRQDLRSTIDTFLARSSLKQPDRMRLFSEYERLLHMLIKAVECRFVIFIDEFSEVCRIIESNLTLKPPASTASHPEKALVDVALIHWLGSLMKSREFAGKLVFIFAVRPFVAEYDRKRELQLLKLTTPITLYHLEQNSSRALITDPVRVYFTFEDMVVDYLCDLTAGHPYLIQYIMKQILDRMRREARSSVTMADVKAVEQKMIEDGPSYEAVFEVLDSDYSLDEVMNPERSLLGRGILAMLASMGDQAAEGWVSGSDLIVALSRYGCHAADVHSILNQLHKSRIVDEKKQEGELFFRMWIPLVRKRYVGQRMIEKYLGVVR